jgi:hypothetical protein
MRANRLFFGQTTAFLEETMRIDIGIVAATAFSTLCVLSSASHAVGGGGPGAAPTPSRAPIGAPPSPNSAAINEAYEFRNRMSSDPACQELARQSDAIYTNTTLDDAAKKQALEQIRNKAKAAGCA